MKHVYGTHLWNTAMEQKLHDSMQGEWKVKDAVKF
jgi:hypothetical protein